MYDDLKREAMVSSHDLLRKGEIVTYKGKEARVIGVNPLLIIKLENRILCGALHRQIESTNQDFAVGFVTRRRKLQRNA